MAASATIDEVRRVISAAVDGAFYRAAYPDVAQTGADPIGHYAADGWREGRDPAPWFSSHAYLEANPDVRSTGVEPLYHYLTAGRLEGREIAPSPLGPAYRTALAEWQRPPGWRFDPPGAGPAPVTLAAPPPTAEPPPEPEPPPAPSGPSLAEQRAADWAVAAPEFDAYWYLENYRDVAAAGVDPLAHFLESGWREGRDPNPRFSVRDYLEIHPDVAEADVNPFVHYLTDGRREGRVPRHQRGFRFDVIQNLVPVTVRAARARVLAATVEKSPAKALSKALEMSRTGLSDLHVTFSHDDYRMHLGGVQLCLQREDGAVSAAGRDHLHLFPAKAWPVVREAGEPGLIGVVWNRKRLAGGFTAKAVADVLRKAVPAGGHGTFAIHSLLGHTADDTADILQAAGMTAGHFWLHDFASLCAGVHLLRNDVQDCAAPPIDSTACGICAYLPLRARHLAEHARLFERLALTVVAPSQPTLDLWRARAPYPRRGEVVLPHALLIPRGRGARPSAERPLRVAFCGTPSALKGWPIFRELAVNLAFDGRYEFFHLGGRRQPGLPIEFHAVTAGRAAPQAMRDRLEALEIDVALVWPICRETFSFTAYEAVAAGCAVVTGPDSGNVQAFVREGGHGWVLPDEAALTAAFATGEVLSLARDRRKPQAYDLDFSAMTADLAEVRP